MIHKRPFLDEDSFEFPCKHPKQGEYSSSHIALPVDVIPPNNALQIPQTTADEGEQRFSSVTEGSNEFYKDFGVGNSGCISQFSWPNNCNSELGSDFETALHFSFFPEYFAPSHQLRALLQSDEIYSSLLDSAPLKQIPIGPEHQVDIPEWGSHSSRMVDDEKLMGLCVVPMPDSEASANYFLETPGLRNDCKCVEMGSIECVRKHVMEAREKLRNALGQKLFEELGFCDMGEVVSEKWQEEEELKFNEVVFSNPSSMGKNFWNCLSEIFPSWTKQDLVSYYFNVFILRKRAEQNRFDPLNIDSDNDEWHLSGIGAAEENDDSGVDSLPRNDTSSYNQEDCEDEHEIDDGKDGDTNAVSTFTADVDEGNNDICKTNGRNSTGENSGNTISQILDKVHNTVRECDAQYDSCTSYECPQGKVNWYGQDVRTNEKQSSRE